MNSIFNNIITLSKRVATSLLRDEQPTDLQNSELFNDQDKQYILNNLTNNEPIKQRLNLANQIDKEADWKKLRSKMDIPVVKIYWKYAAAATIIIALTSTYFLRNTLFNNATEPTSPIIVNNQIQPGKDKATLTLETGESVALEKGITYQTQNAKSNGEEIVYEAGDKSTFEIDYNTLTIPRGGQFQVTLSDGTNVWLNSETQLKYPVSFTDGLSRQVELVYGEAYFDVSPSTGHKGSDFKVYHNQQEVKVLGTEFNIKAYNNEANIYTTLVEGKVEINTQLGNNTLSPGEQSVYNAVNNTIKVTSVEIRPETAWKEGVYIFKDKGLKNIMQTLSRWYDMDVVFENKELEDIKFIGSLYKNQKIVDVLNDIKSFGVIKNYNIHNKTITLE
ncbi:FecR family protein [Flavivirga sp. 57AJ16]|uniref:FecR family protein n=1 Tax=Flavivirga sp. 57AJ16 TaxID=3025307 RepID=UPI0023667A10|nr:FecR family protein [Flavivirga sp. 57AJ16]MDD7886254.1 FecR domain-containing protein [Flavivirga sp. 57AJ16]